MGRLARLGSRIQQAYAAGRDGAPAGVAPAYGAGPDDGHPAAAPDDHPGVAPVDDDRPAAPVDDGHPAAPVDDDRPAAAPDDGSPGAALESDGRPAAPADDDHGTAPENDGRPAAPAYGAGPGAAPPGAHGPTAPASPDRTVPVPVASPASRDDELVPRGLRLAAAYSWRLLLIAAGAVAVLWVVGKLRLVFIPLAVALLLSALFSPMVEFLIRRARMHRSLASALVLIGGVIAVAGTLTLVVTQFINGFPALQQNAVKGIRQIQDWLRSGPLHLSDSQLNNAIDAAQNWANTHRETLTSGAVATAATVLELLAGLFLVLFATFFFLRDGRRIWFFLAGMLPSAVRPHVATAGVAAWRTLVNYVRATVLVAFIDAVGIGVGLAVMRVDFAFPLAALVFLGAFIPIVGATLSGTVAVLVALVTRGPFWALAVLALIIGIQQFEGHVLQPLIMGRAVAIHPLAVIVAIAAGAVLAGIVGALVAVPVVAVLNTAVRHLRARRAHEPPPPDTLPVIVRDEG